MLFHKPHPVDSFENLKDRVERFLRTPMRRAYQRTQLSLDLPTSSDLEIGTISPSKNVSEFLAFMTDAVPDGDIYLFGGVLRDLALLGRRGFNSDIDLVVEGDWDHCIPYLQTIGARRNKFGGYRLEVAGWPIDIWNAKETWAIRQGFVEYLGIASLTKTTVLNWDAILMNWRTRNFIYREGYLNELKARLLDIVLEQNPNPLGMAVRVFRHLGTKDARKVTSAAAEYLANCTSRYSYDVIRDSEIRSYGNSTIEPAIYKFFAELKRNEYMDIQTRFKETSEKLKREGTTLSYRQSEWNFDKTLNDSQS